MIPDEKNRADREQALKSFRILGLTKGQALSCLRAAYRGVPATRQEIGILAMLAQEGGDVRLLRLRRILAEMADDGLLKEVRP